MFWLLIPALTGWMDRRSGKMARTGDGTAERCDEIEPTGPPAATHISNAQTYVLRMTEITNEGGSVACQGLHKSTVLPYGCWGTVRLTVTRYPM
jgi:hypothetical protein